MSPELYGLFYVYACFAHMYISEPLCGLGPHRGTGVTEVVNYHGGAGS